jgi:hypothetical protein
VFERQPYRAFAGFVPEWLHRVQFGSDRLLVLVQKSGPLAALPSFSESGMVIQLSRMATAGDLFEELARAVWHRLADGERLGVRQGETTITDHILLELARLNDPGLRIVKTPLDQEDVKGTDWEWWVGSFSVGWIRYAVQAKRLDLQKRRYPNLGHKVGSSSQMQILESFASANRAVPLYCFYNHVEEADFGPYWHCNRPLDKEQLGCSVASLPVVKSGFNTRGGRSFHWMHSVGCSLPWRCLLRCPAFTTVLQAPDGSRSLPVNAQQFFGIAPLLYPELPRELLRSLDTPARSQEIENFDADFYNAELGLYPKRIAIIQVSLSVESGQEQR